MLEQTIFRLKTKIQNFYDDFDWLLKIIHDFITYTKKKSDKKEKNHFDGKNDDKKGRKKKWRNKHMLGQNVS